MRKTIIVRADRPEDRERLALWFHDWLDELAFVSDNDGCRCCCDIFYVDASAEAVSRLWREVSGLSEWEAGTWEPERRLGPPELPYQELLRPKARLRRP